MRDVRTVLVVGAGTMGHGIAQTFAANGLQVYLADQKEEFVTRGKGWIRDNLEYMVSLGELKAEEVEPILSRVHPTTDMAGAAAKADYVVEAVYENLELKRTIFALLGEHAAPDVVLATNTSSFDINELCAVTKHPERVIGTHYFHPPQITPCVEVIPATATSSETFERAMSLLECMGKAPTICRSAPGFVANRIQLAMAAEAIAIVEAGLATPADVDRIVKNSFGFRLSAYGPFEILDQAGADTYDAIYKYLHPKLGREQFRPSPLLARQVEAGRLGLKTSGGFYDYGEGAADKMKRERDKKLYRRLRLFREEDAERRAQSASCA